MLIYAQNAEPSSTPGHATVSNDIAKDTTMPVGCEPNDPLNPQYWRKWKKVGTNAMTASVAFISGFGSSIDSPVIPQAAESFHVSQGSRITSHCSLPPRFRRRSTIRRTPLRDLRQEPDISRHAGTTLLLDPRVSFESQLRRPAGFPIPCWLFRLDGVYNCLVMTSITRCVGRSSPDLELWLCSGP